MKVLLLVLLLCLNVQAYCEEVSSNLFKPISPEKTQKLKAYNRRQILSFEFFSLRTRIVEVDTEMLLKSKSFTFKPFSDSNSVVFTGEVVQGYRKDVTKWVGKQSLDLFEFSSGGLEEDVSLRELEKTFNEKFPESNILLTPWDIDTQGIASWSAKNVFEHSEIWAVNPDGSVYVDKLNYKGSDFVQYTDPPKTPKDIAHHKKMKALRKNAFRSATAEIRIMDFDNNIQVYRLHPLRYTPKYSILTQVDPTRIRYKKDDPAESKLSEKLTALESNERQRAFDEYNEHINSLPDFEIDKKIMGDIK